MNLTKRIASVTLSLAMCFGPYFAIGGTQPIKKDEVQNVILLIGDGMGFNHLELAKQERGEALTMDTFPIKGSSQTRSASSAVTDSAAGATALSCGVRTGNGMVGVFMLDPLGAFVLPTSITENAIAAGMSAGVVTSDSTAGATPSGFSAHTYARSNSKSISKQQMSSDLDLIWGAACSDVDKQTAQDNGFSYITTLDEMNALSDSSKSFGQFAGDTWKSSPEDATTPRLSEMTSKAIEILDDDEDGFFLMVEGAHIDKHSHGSNGKDNYAEKVANATQAVYEFDLCVSIAKEYAQSDGNTLVIVTADHETGGIELIDGKYTYTATSHTGDNVPLLVYGSSDFIQNEESIKNKDIPYFIAASLGIADSFYTTISGTIPSFFKKLFGGTK